MKCSRDPRCLKEIPFPCHHIHVKFLGSTSTHGPFHTTTFGLQEAVEIYTQLYQHRPQITKTNFCVIKGTTSTPPKLVVTPPHHSTLQRQPSMAPRPLLQSWSSPCPPTIAHYNGTHQWHHVHSSKVGHHPAPQTKAHYNGTLQCHHVHSREVGRHPPPQPSHTTMAPCNGTQQWHHVHSPKVGRHPPPNHSTLQWHPTKAPSNGTTSIAPCNGTQQWQHVHSTIAHYNGTRQWHPAMAPRPRHPAMAFWPRPMRKSGSSPSPPIGSKNPYSYRDLGKNIQLYNISYTPAPLKGYQMVPKGCQFNIP